METINDIVREMRKKADLLSIAGEGDDLFELADRVEAAWEYTRKHSMYCTAHNCKLREIVESVTDCNQHETVDLESRCIYGAAKDAEPVGNAAKMRKALKEAKRTLCRWQADLPVLAWVEVETALCKIESALSAPPRNCDRFADELDAQLAFLNEVWLIFVTKDAMLERDKFENWTEEMKSRYAKWLFAEAKGDAK